MALIVALLFLLARDPFTVGKTELREAMAGAEVLLVTAIYMFPPLRCRFPV